MISHSSPSVMAPKPFWLVIFFRFIPLLVAQVILFTLIVAQKPSKNCLDCLIKNHIYNYERRSDFALLWNRELQESINETCRENLICLPQALEQFLETNTVDCSGDSTIDCLDHTLTLQFGRECRSHSQGGNIFRFWAHSAFSPCFRADSVPQPVQPELATTLEMIPSQVIDSECLRCICSASTDCDLNATCTDNRCGPYMISRDQYEKADQPGESFDFCASSKNCSELVLQRFMAKNAQDCNNDGTINCEDFAAFHKFGSNCYDNKLRSTDFWFHFEYCTIMADDVRREPNPWDNTGIRSNYSADSVPPLVVAPILFNSVPLLTTTLDSGINQIISIDYNCFNCIHQASSAYNDSSIYSGELHGCGPFMISKMYFSRVNVLDNNMNYENCCRSRECSEKVVQAYVESNPFDCNRDGYLDCLDYAIIHRLGAEKCKFLEDQDNFMESLYWAEFQTCYGFD